VDLSDILVGASPAMQRVRSQVERFAPLDIPVLVSGPTGSGKELVGAALHRLSGRAGRYVPFNVCAISDTMFEDALYGHVRGAFTGAACETRGYLAEADNGTLCLDEISGLSLGLQAKLLRAIETKSYRQLGASADRRSNFRVVSATNEELSDLVRRGQFRRCTSAAAIFRCWRATSLRQAANLTSRLRRVRLRCLTHTIGPATCAS
jgi:transcriptional regulator with PAS, ATPase and Fis domain